MNNNVELGFQKNFYFPCTKRKNINDAKEGKRLLKLDTVWRVGLVAVPTIISTAMTVGAVLAMLHLTGYNSLLAFCGFLVIAPVNYGFLMGLISGPCMLKHNLISSMHAYAVGGEAPDNDIDRFEFSRYGCFDAQRTWGFDAFF